MRHLARLVTLVLLAAGLACSDSTAPTHSGITGTWYLQTLNGRALPVVVRQDAISGLEVVGDTYTFSSTGTFTQSTQRGIIVNGDVSPQYLNDAGRYTLNGQAVEVTYHSDNTSVTGSWDGQNTITIAAAGLEGVYRRQ